VNREWPDGVVSRGRDWKLAAAQRGPAFVSI
jgi:hypothetical protein